MLTGCGSGGTTATSSEGRASGGALAQDSAAAKSGTGTKNSAPVAPADASKSGVVGVGPKLTKSASLDLRVKNIDAAAAQVRTIATGLQAQVLSEQIGTGGSGGPVPLQAKSDARGGFGTLALSVPADKLDTALDQLARIGTVLQRNLSTQDVTAQYVDTESRLKTMRASVERVRALMTQAKDIGQVVVLESELSRREADLESLESQLSTPGHETVSNTGFVAGMRSGWDAFTSSARGLFTVIGAVLPFAVFFALAAAPPVWWLRRRGAGSTGEVNG